MAENELLDNFKNWKYNQIDDEFTIDFDKANYLYEKNFNLDWMPIDMRDGSGETIINLKTGEISKDRFKKVGYPRSIDCNLTKVVLKDDTETLLDITTNKLFDERFKSISATKFKNLYYADLLDDSGITLFNAEIKKVFIERFKDMFGAGSGDLIPVEMLDGSGKTLFNPISKKLFSQRYKHIFPTKIKNIYIISDFENPEYETLFDYKTLFDAEKELTLNKNFTHIAEVDNKTFACCNYDTLECGYYNSETREFKNCNYNKDFDKHFPSADCGYICRMEDEVSALMEITNAKDLLKFIEEYKNQINTPVKTRK